MDIAKQVFQLHTVDMGTGEIVNVQIKRAKVMEHFANKVKRADFPCEEGTRDLLKSLNAAAYCQPPQEKSTVTLSEVACGMTVRPCLVSVTNPY